MEKVRSLLIHPPKKRYICIYACIYTGVVYIERYMKDIKNIMEENQHVWLMSLITISTKPRNVLENSDRANPKWK